MEFGRQVVGAKRDPMNGDVGPDLTHLMIRNTIASGAALNTPENLRTWIHDLSSVEPAATMPAF
jgi:cytochrome c oxidase subunit 2